MILLTTQKEKKTLTEVGSINVHFINGAHTYVFRTPLKMRYVASQGAILSINSNLIKKIP